MTKKFIIAMSSLLILTGCGSSELSPAEKRNNFDKCVLDYLEEKYLSKGNRILPHRTQEAENACKDLLG